MNGQKIIVLAAGGTGGHIFPAEALASELQKRGFRAVLITDKRFESYSKKPEWLEVHTIHAGGPARNLFGRAVAGMLIGIGYLQARRLLRKLKPAAAVGFGGYPSFSTMLAAVHRGLKTVIHEQNSVLGRTNAFLAPRVHAIATSFQEVSGISEEDLVKNAMTGNPVRPSVKALRIVPYPELKPGGVMKILVTGGSQGASVFSEVVPEALRLLPEELRARIRIDQQCRANEIDGVRAKYSEMRVSADLAAFFDDVPVRLASSHVMIARSGASTLAEVTAAGRPIIMVPYPHAKDNHQMANANAVEEGGGGWVIPQDAFTPQVLAEKLKMFFGLPDMLKDAAAKSLALGCPDADIKLADLVERLVWE